MRGPLLESLRAVGSAGHAEQRQGLHPEGFRDHANHPHPHLQTFSQNSKSLIIY